MNFLLQFSFLPFSLRKFYFKSFLCKYADSMVSGNAWIVNVSNAASHVQDTNITDSSQVYDLVVLCIYIDSVVNEHSPFVTLLLSLASAILLVTDNCLPEYFIRKFSKIFENIMLYYIVNIPTKITTFINPFNFH